MPCAPRLGPIAEGAHAKPLWWDQHLAGRSSSFLVSACKCVPGDAVSAQETAVNGLTICFERGFLGRIGAAPESTPEGLTDLLDKIYTMSLECDEHDACVQNGLIQG